MSNPHGRRDEKGVGCSILSRESQRSTHGPGPGTNTSPTRRYHTHTLSLSLFLALPRSLAARGGNRPLGSCSRSPGGRSSGMAQCCTAVCKNVLGLRRPWGKSQGHLPSQHHPGRHRVNHSRMAEPSQARFAQPNMGCQMEPRTIPQGTVPCRKSNADHTRHTQYQVDRKSVAGPGPTASASASIHPVRAASQQRQR